MKRVMIVEDNLDLQFLYKRALALEGYKVILASNGRQALDILKSSPELLPHVIILDLMMPVMDGHQFIEERAKDPHLSDIPVVVCSASKERTDIQGVERFLNKPIDLDALLRTIESSCRDLPRA